MSIFAMTRRTLPFFLSISREKRDLMWRLAIIQNAAGANNSDNNNNNSKNKNKCSRRPGAGVLIKIFFLQTLTMPQDPDLRTNPKNGSLPRFYLHFHTFAHNEPSLLLLLLLSFFVLCIFCDSWIRISWIWIWNRLPSGSLKINIIMSRIVGVCRMQCVHFLGSLAMHWLLVAPHLEAVKLHAPTDLV